MKIKACLSFVVAFMIATNTYGVGRSGHTEIPSDAEIEVDLELRMKDARADVLSVDGVLTVKNVGRQSLRVQSPTNRRTVTFVVLNSRGNIVEPVFRAKADPQFLEMTLEPKAKIKEVFEGLKFITGTAQFGYDLKRGEKYSAVAIYRPGGPDGIGICSREVTINTR